MCGEGTVRSYDLFSAEVSVVELVAANRAFVCSVSPAACGDVGSSALNSQQRKKKTDTKQYNQQR